MDINFPMELNGNKAAVVEEDAACDVCRSSEVEDVDDKIIFCDKCNVAVHQGCYGVEQIPNESWFCKPCQRDLRPICIFCQQENGAMKSTTDGEWAHVNCTLWIPEVNFANPETLDDIQNVDKIPKSRWHLSCFICRKKGGACIQCYVPTCKTAYHVTCGYNNNLHMRIEDIESSESELIFESFCRHHTDNPHLRKTRRAKKKKNINESNNQSSTDDTKKARRDSDFQTYLKNLEEEMNSNGQRNSLEDTSIPETTDKTNGNDDEVIEKEFAFDATNTEAEKEIKNADQTIENAVEETVKPKENGTQVMENETEGLLNVSNNRTYIGTTLVAKATARKSCGLPNKVTKKKISLTNILPKAIIAPKAANMPKSVKTPKAPNLPKTVKSPNAPKAAKAPKAPNKQKASVAKPKPTQKRKVSDQTMDVLSSTNDSKTPPVKKAKHGKQPQSKITSKNERVDQNDDLNTSAVSQAVALPIPPSTEVVTFIQPSSSTENGFPTSSNGQNLTAFLGYLASLLQALPLKKSLKVQRKLITQVLKEHDFSSSSDDISDMSSLSD